MNKTNERNSFLLGLTLTELCFLIFLIFLLINLFKITELSKKNDELSQDLSKYVDENKEIVEKLRLQKIVIKKIEKELGITTTKEANEFLSKLVKSEKLIQENAALNNEIEELKTELKSYAYLEKQIDEVKELENLPITTDYLVDSIKKRKLIEKLAKNFGATNIDNSEQFLANKINEKSKEASNLKGVVKNLQQKCLKGVDHPPCWANRDGHIEYIYTITLHEETLSIERAWPDERMSDLEFIPGASKIINNDYSMTSFGQAVTPVYDWSVENECRHFVRIKDSTNTKKAFKRNLFAVENYFYKFLLRDSQ